LVDILYTGFISHSKYYKSPYRRISLEAIKQGGMIKMAKGKGKDKEQK
jgi:hypothetical protein